MCRPQEGRLVCAFHNLNVPPGQCGAIRLGILTDLSLNPSSTDYQPCNFIQVMEHFEASVLISEMGMETVPTLQQYLEEKTTHSLLQILPSAGNVVNVPFPSRVGGDVT